MIIGIDLAPTRLAVARLSMEGVVLFTACERITTDPPAQIRGLLKQSCAGALSESLEFPGIRGIVNGAHEPQVVRAESPYAPAVIGPRNLKMLGAVMARVEDACRSLWPWAPFEWVSPVNVWKGIGGTGGTPRADALKRAYREFAEARAGVLKTQDECDAVCIAYGAVDLKEAA